MLVIWSEGIWRENTMSNKWLRATEACIYLVDACCGQGQMVGEKEQVWRVYG